MSSVGLPLPTRAPPTVELNSLTDEILIKIFVYIDFKIRHGRLPFVCQRWARLIKSNELWRDVRVAPQEEHALTGSVVSQTKVFRWCSQPHVRPCIQSLMLTGLGGEYDDFTAVGLGALLGICCSALTQLKLKATRVLLNDLSFLLCLGQLKDLALCCVDPDPLNPFHGSDVQCVAQLPELRSAVFDLNLVIVPGDLSQLKKLKFLSVSGTGSSSLILPYPLSKLQLSELVVKNPLWAEVPDVVGKFPKLKSLEIRGHPYAHNLAFSPSAGRMHRLECLGIVAHRLQRTPEAVAEMVFLRKLNLSWNSFDERLPVEVVFPFKKLCRLMMLDLSNCNLKHIPTAISALESLAELNLSGNLLDGISPVLSHCHSLKKLFVRACGFEAVPLEISEIPNLEHLDISNNPIFTVESLSALLERDRFVALVFRQERWNPDLVMSACRIARIWGKREPVIR